MVVRLLDDPDVVFQALADATRRDILARTMDEALSVSALAGHYPMSFAAVQKHVAVLERAHLVTKQRRGREALVSADVQTIRAASQVLDQLEDLWRGRYQRIGEALVDEPEQGENQ